VRNASSPDAATCKAKGRGREKGKHKGMPLGQKCKQKNPQKGKEKGGGLSSSSKIYCKKLQKAEREGVGKPCPEIGGLEVKKREEKKIHGVLRKRLKTHRISLAQKQQKKTGYGTNNLNQTG